MITNVALTSNSFVIDGPSVDYQITVSNPGSSDASTIIVQTEIVQGNADKGAGGTQTNCAGAGSGVVPAGGCTSSWSATASNSNGGSGTLTPGNAKLVFSLYQYDGTNTILLDSKTLKISLVPRPAPYFSDVSPSFTSLQIDGPQSSYSVTIQNPTGVNQFEIFIQAEVIQGSAFKGAGGTDVTCFPNNSSPGLLPPGSCTFTSFTSASNSAGGNGTLVAGAAIWRLTLYRYDSATNTTTQLEVREFNITLTGP